MGCRALRTLETKGSTTSAFGGSARSGGGGRALGFNPISAGMGHEDGFKYRKHCGSTQ